MQAANGTPCSREGNLLRLLTTTLAADGVRYCRWKARLDLHRLLSGAGDLDLLVDRSDADALVRVAERLGFKRVTGCFEPCNPHELHLYGLDQETGALLHLHVAALLLRNGSIARSMAPSLEELVLRHSAPERGPHLLEGMPVVRPPAELVIFILGTIEQYCRLSQFPRLIARKHILEAQLQALLARDKEESWKSLLQRCLPAVSSVLFSEWLTALEQPTPWLRRYLLAKRLRRQVQNAAVNGSLPRGDVAAGSSGPDLRNPALVVRLENWLRAGWWRLVHGRGNPKQLLSGGSVIAFVGPDASGKSTMVAETSRWLGKVFRVKTAHLGKPPSTGLTWLPNVAGRLLVCVAPGLRTINQQAAPGGSNSGKQGLLYRVRAVLLAWDRRALARRLARLAGRGWLVVCDRYPSECIGAPDSARLKTPEQEPGQTWLWACLARLEQRLYRQIPPPDIAVQLSAPLGVAIDRNRERQKSGKEGDEFVARRHKEFFVPPFRTARLVQLDTNCSSAESARRLQRLLWADLGRPTRNGSARNAPARNGQALQLGAANQMAARDARHNKGRQALVVEFIGATGVGKSTLVAALTSFLSAQGVRVRDAEELILARYGLAFPHHPKLRSALILLLSLRQFWRYVLTRGGARLSRLAVGSIGRGMGSFRVGANLLRNFMKRIGAHLLLERLRAERSDCDVVIWDEGVVHAAHNLFVHGATEPKRDEIEKFGHMVPKPDVLIWVTAPTAQSAQVLLARGHPRVQATTSAARIFAEHAQTTFELLSSVQELRERIYRVDNSARATGDERGAVNATASVIGEFLVKNLNRHQQQSPRSAAPACASTHEVPTS